MFLFYNKELKLIYLTTSIQLDKLIKKNLNRLK